MDIVDLLRIVSEQAAVHGAVEVYLVPGEQPILADRRVTPRRTSTKTPRPSKRGKGRRK